MLYSNTLSNLKQIFHIIKSIHNLSGWLVIMLLGNMQAMKIHFKIWWTICSVISLTNAITTTKTQQQINLSRFSHVSSCWCEQILNVEEYSKIFTLMVHLTTIFQSFVLKFKIVSHRLKTFLTYNKFNLRNYA